MKTCQLCSKSYNLKCRKPIKLDCGHNFCLKCVYNLRKKDSKCPIDKKILKIQKNLKKKKKEKLKNKIKFPKSNFNYNFNIITIGTKNTGKTSLLTKYFKNIYKKNSKPTIIKNFLEKPLKIKNDKILLKGFDFISQKKKPLNFDFSEKECILYIFDITNKKSFLEIKKLKKFFENKNKKNCVEILVGNKGDLVDERKVGVDEAMFFVKESGMSYFEVSSKLDINVKELFNFVVVKCYKVFESERMDSFCEENDSWLDYFKDIIIF